MSSSPSAQTTCVPKYAGDDCSTSSTQTTPRTTTPPTETPTTPAESKSSTPTATPTQSESGITSPTINENNIPVCTSGCLFVKTCLPYGYRTTLSYCNIDNNLIKQIDKGNCVNNFECVSNVCVEGKCTSPGLFLQFINWFQTLFGVK